MDNGAVGGFNSAKKCDDGILQDQHSSTGVPVATRLHSFGQSIFDTMSQCAVKYEAINLGQGFSDYPAPDFVIDEAIAQIRQGNNQYAPARGVPVLRQAIVAERARRQRSELPYDADTECLVTVGATEAMTAAVLALVNPGDQVVVIEPYYDSYPAAVALAGGYHTSVALHVQEDRTWRLDLRKLEDAITDETKLLIINTPHNPTGMILNDQDLQAVADLCIAHDVYVLSDEVYERLIFEGTHRSIAELAGMRERTIVISSAGKTFNATGWKTGWALGPQDLIKAIAHAKQHLTYVGTTPTQPAIAKGLQEGDEWVWSLRDTLKSNRDRLLSGLEEMGLTVYPAQAGYFIVADLSPWGLGNAEESCYRLARDYGVVAIPVTAFVDDPKNPRYSTLIRFAFCKDRSVIDEALRRLRTVKSR